MSDKEKPGPALSYGRQSLDDADVAAVVAALRGDWLTQGPAVAMFERALAARLGAAAAVSCANGTAGLHLAFLALDLKRADAVIVPSLTFLATANAVHFAGGTVVFCDVDPEAGLMTPETAGAACARARAAGLTVRALVPVHFAGQSCDMAALADVAASFGAVVVEDACHAIGSVFIGPDGASSMVGACRHSLMTIFSFHPVKTIACGEGGAALTNDLALARRLARLRSHGVIREPEDFVNHADGETDGEPNPWYYEMREPGLNYRLSDIHAALGASQLEKLESFVARRRALMGMYQRRFDEMEMAGAAARLLRVVPWCEPAWHLCAALIDFSQIGVDRRRLTASLRARGIGSQVHYYPVHRQPFWRQAAPGLALPGADACYERLLSLPLFPGMSDTDPDRVMDALEAAMGGA